MFKETEDWKKFQEMHFHSTMYTFQIEKINGCNCAWCIHHPKDESKGMKCEGFILLPRAVIRNNEQTFGGNLMLAIEIDLQELRYPSKSKKLGSTTKNVNIKRKNLFRSKTHYSMCFKHRSIYAFSALKKNQKKSLLEYLKVYSFQCGLLICPNNNIEHAYLDFGSNIVETNHSLTCEDKVEIHMDHMFPACMYCGKEEISLDATKGNRPMCKDYLKGKELVPKGLSKADKDEHASEAIKKVQVEKNRQATIYFPSTSKKTKLEDFTGLTLVKAGNKHTNQVSVKSHLFKLDFSKSKG